MHHLVGAVAGCEAVVAHAMVGLLIATVWQAVVALVLAIVVALVLLAVFVALLLAVVVRVEPSRPVWPLSSGVLLICIAK